MFDKEKKIFELPREGRRLRVDEVDCVALVSGTGGGSDWYSQLQLWSVQGDRFLLVPAFIEKELKPMLSGLKDSAGIQARHFTENKRFPDGWLETAVA